MNAPNGFNGKSECPIKLEMSLEMDKLAPALVRVQSAVHGVAKSSDNPFFNSKYADLAACLNATRDELSDNGLAVTQYPCVLDDGGAGLVTLLLHESGQWIRGVMPIRPAKEGPQPFGSEYTYMRRYSYAGVLGLAQVDDDAESATFRMSKPMETKIITAMEQAIEADDHGAIWETWSELEEREKEYINNTIDRQRKARWKTAILAAAATFRENAA